VLPAGSRLVYMTHLMPPCRGAGNAELFHPYITTRPVVVGK